MYNLAKIQRERLPNQALDRKFKTHENVFSFNNRKIILKISSVRIKSPNFSLFSLVIPCVVFVNSWLQFFFTITAMHKEMKSLAQSAAGDVNKIIAANCVKIKVTQSDYPFF
jgi:hypothetical protein